MRVDLTEMRPGETGTVIETAGGCEFERRIQSMGIRIGKEIKKVSSHFWRGPQTIQIDNTQIALGFGMARKIMVEVKRDENK